MRNLRKNCSSESSLTLHTHQQTLILEEMMCARNKLEEENQLLRDKLQDSEMMIRLLHLKLEEVSSSSTTSSDASGEGKKINKGNVSIAVPPSSSLMGWRQKRRSHTPSQRRDAFKNTMAPGKRTFEPPPKQPELVGQQNANYSATLKSSEPHITKGIGRSEILRSGDPRVRYQEPPIEDPPEDDPSVATLDSEITVESADSVVTEEAVKITTRAAASRNNYKSPREDPPMRSVIGMLAQSVINEYSIYEC